MVAKGCLEALGALRQQSGGKEAVLPPLGNASADIGKPGKEWEECVGILGALRISKGKARQRCRGRLRNRY
eukprot:1300852-Alexandrium_andersonii.AAC.1